MSSYALARAVLARLRFHTDPSHDLDLSADQIAARRWGERRYYGLLMCTAHVDRYIVHYFPKAHEIVFRLLRCPLKYGCPRCMSPDNIVRRRERDFQLLRGATEAMGDRHKIWLIQQASETEPPPIKRFSQALERSDQRRSPILDGIWAGEAAICAPPTAIETATNGRPGRAVFVFNALVCAEFCTSLHIERLSKFLPNSNIREFSCLLPAWTEYLTSWSYAQIYSRTPEDIEAWMLGGRRYSFQAIGLFRGFRAEMERIETSRRHEEKGKAIMLGLCDASQPIDDILSHCDQNMQDRYQQATGEELGAWERREMIRALSREIEQTLKREETMKIQRELKKLQEQVAAQSAEMAAHTAKILAKIDKATGGGTLDEERKERKQQARASKKVQ